MLSTKTTDVDRSEKRPVYILGVDPGFSGGLAFIEMCKLEVIRTSKMPILVSPTSGKKSVDAKKVADFLRSCNAETQGQGFYAVIEAVHAGPKDGVVSAFSFGQGYGTVLGVLGALDITTRFAHPAVWKKALGLSYIKQESNDLVRKVFPKNADEFRLAKNNGVAEAILIAWYGAKLTGFQTGSVEFSNLL